MNMIEILLIILGVVAFLASFIIKGKPEAKNETVSVDPEIIKDMVEKEMAEAKDRVNEVVDETLQYAVEKTERASERISNEKIMAISEYSDTVLADINKNHQEVLFLYDMLNEKHDHIKETVKQVDKTAKEIAKEIAPEPEPIQEVPTPEPVLAAQTAQIVQMPIQPKPEVPEINGEEQVIEENVEEEIEGEKTASGDELEPENNNDRILEMHKEGKNNVDIAKELGLGVGEVKLVINLFKGAI